MPTCIQSLPPARPGRPAGPRAAGWGGRAGDQGAGPRGAPAGEQLAADTFFHYTIAGASGSPRLHALIRQVSAIPEAYRSVIAYTGGDMAEAERQHRAIAGA